MDRNEQNLRIEEIRTAMRAKAYKQAAEMAETLDLKKIKDNNSLNLVAEAYESVGDYDMAKEVLLLAYDNTNSGRHIAYKLCIISIKTKDFEGAKEYYEDFIEIAPRDNARYILKYRMAKAENKPIEELISILEEYVHLDMEERWAYELARLYHKAGERDKCVDMCDEISLWFAEGKYVNKAMELKQRYAPLTPAQQETYDDYHTDHITVEKDLEVQQEKEVNVHNIEPEQKKEEQNIHKRRPFEVNADMIMPTGNDEEEIVEDTEGKNGSQSRITGEMEEIIMPEMDTEEEKSEIKEESDDIIEEELTEEISEEFLEEQEIPKDIEQEETISIKMEEQTDENNEVLHNIDDVSNILRQLQERGILKAETVEQAVNIIDEAGTVKSDTDETKSEEIYDESINGDAMEETPVDDVVGEADILDEALDAEQTEEDIKAQEREEQEPIIHQYDNVEIIEKADVEIIRKKEPEIEDEEEAVEQQSIEDSSDTETGNTQIFDRAQVLEEIDRMEKEEKPQVVPVIESEDSVPVLDLSFEPPMRDDSNDIGQKNMYENIAANSDLGYKTDKLPTREELQEAIKKAEQAVKGNVAEESNELEEVLDLKVKVKPSSKVEVLAGAGVVDEGTINNEEFAAKEQQPEVQEQTVDNNIVRESTGKINTEIKEEIHREEKPAVKSEDGILSEEELTEFKNYLNVEGFESNVREVLQGLIVNFVPNGKSDRDNVIIMGNEKTGKTTLAIELVKLVNKKRGRRNRKLAKVDAASLNRKGFRYALTKLIGSDLIVENAHTLGKMTLSEIVDVSGMFTDDMLIVLEGQTEGMEALLQTSPRAGQVFNRVIRIKEYDIKEWVEYGKQYAIQQGYTVDELANLAFYKAIDDFFGVNKGIGQKDVEDIIDNAIAKSGRIGRKVKNIFGSKTDDEGLTLLQESDFNI